MTYEVCKFIEVEHSYFWARLCITYDMNIAVTIALSLSDNGYGRIGIFDESRNEKFFESP